MTNELLPCPFCGGEAEETSVIRYGFEDYSNDPLARRFYVQCKICGVAGDGNVRSAEVARKAWNRRFVSAETKKAERPTWDRHFMNMARITAEMSTCPRASVGCVLVRDKRLLVSGHNGAAAGLPHCTEIGCIMKDGHCIAAIHAEQNAIIQAAKHGIDTVGSVAYCTHYPCCHCSKILINAGVQRVVYLIAYPDKHSDLFFYQAKIPVERIEL